MALLAYGKYQSYVGIYSDLRYADLSQPEHPITYIYMNFRLQLNSWPL
jgi:hypothetical protein